MPLQLKGQAEVNVVATAVRTDIKVDQSVRTLVNTGTSAMYFRYDPGSATATLAGASAAAIKVLGGIPIKGGEAVVIPAGIPWIDVACISGESTTLDIIPGVMVDSTSITAMIGVVTANAGTNLNTSALALEAGGNLAALLAGASPAASTGLASVITTDAEWTSITLTAGALFADVTLIGDKAYVVAQTATPADADTGCVYAANIVYRIPTRGRTKIWIRRYAGTNVRIHVTDYK